MKIELENGKIINAESNDKIINFIKKISSSMAKESLYVKINGKSLNLEDEIIEGKLKIIKKTDIIDEKLINKNSGWLISKAVKKLFGYNTINFEANKDGFLIDFEVEEYLTDGEIKKAIKNALSMKLTKSDIYKDEIILNNFIKFIEITSLSGLKSDIKSNRITGYGSFSESDLEAKKIIIKERQERDHRKIGKELEIFMIDEKFGKGLPIWLPNGVTLKQTIRNFLQKEEKKYNYVQVETPALGSLSFYETSGHYSHYKDSMFPIMKIEEDENYILRPMVCPHHCLIYKRKPRSYKELPIRLAEQVKQYRYEASGALLGLERVRAMELTDSHIFLTIDQLKKELKNVYELIRGVLNKFDIKIEYVELALHNPNDTKKYHGNEEIWKESESILKEFLKNNNIKHEEKIGEAAFYGPKIDIQIKTALKHIITVSTIQLDFFLPERFDLNYINNVGQEERVIMIHRGLIGTYERFISVILEQTKGNLPMWLAPQQAVVIPIKKEIHGEYAKQIHELLIDNDVRSQLDDSDERLSYKIRKYQTSKVKTQIVIGDKELENKTITYRMYGQEEEVTIALNDILKIYK